VQVSSQHCSFARVGADLYLTVRDMKKGQDVVKDIMDSPSSNQGKLELLHFELDSLQSVRDCAEHFLSRSSSLNILINNAGKQLFICHVAVLSLQWTLAQQCSPSTTAITMC